ncbi:MAG: hypothetical protein V3T30_03795 [Thermodesulfobacteriota bacterium]
MAFNMMIHILMGFLGTTFFVLTPEGIIYALLITIFTQSSNLFTIHKARKIKIEESSEYRMKDKPAKVAEMTVQFKKEIPMILSKNVGIFTIVVLVTAEVCRINNLGI